MGPPLQIFYLVYVPLLVPGADRDRHLCAPARLNEYLYAFLLLSTEKYFTILVAMAISSSPTTRLEPS